jgi:hypothetical protein
VSSDRRALWVAIAVVSASLLLLFGVPKVREELRPDVIGALVAVQIGSEPTARVGAVDIEVGESFSLYAVLRAESRSGDTVYYTQAPGLEIAGQPVEADHVRPWPGGDEIRVLWFTVEGFRPFLEPASIAELETFHWQETFRPDWGFGWVAAGTVAPHNRNLSRAPENDADLPFGTAYFHVRVEEYFRSGDPTPIARHRSPGAEALPGHPERLSRVVARLPGSLASVSELFGRVHVEPTGDSSPELSRSVASLFSRGLMFSRLLALDRMLVERGIGLAELEWETVEIPEGPSWGEIGAGDLLRSGERLVVLFEDRGEPGRLDYEDLCFDFFENAAVRPLAEVFRAGGVVSWADLAATEDGG